MSTAMKLMTLWLGLLGFTAGSAQAMERGSVPIGMLCDCAQNPQPGCEPVIEGFINGEQAVNMAGAFGGSGNPMMHQQMTGQGVQNQGLSPAGVSGDRFPSSNGSK